MFALIDEFGCVIGLSYDRETPHRFLNSEEIDLLDTAYNVYEVHSLEELKKVMDQEGSI